MSANPKRLGLLADIVVVIVSFYVTYLVTSAFRGVPLIVRGSSIFYDTFSFLVISWLLSLLLTVEYPPRRLSLWVTEAWIALRTNALGLLFFAILAFLLKYQNFSRLFVGTYFVDTTLLMVLVRIMVRVGLGYVRKRGRDMRTRLIVGGSHQALRYLEGVERRPDLGLRVVGYLAEASTRLPLPHLGEVEDLPQALARHSVDGVVIAMPVTDARMDWVIKQCELQGVSVELMLDGLASRINSSTLTHSLGVSRLVLSPIPHTSTGLALKRATDILISGIALVLASPIMAGVALAIWLDDRGPIIYSQTRVGLHGRRFKMHKFRSMRVDADKIKQQLMHLNEMSGPVFKIRDDPRVTRVGRFLRKTSLDELPQLWDVLVGNMSLVGPRPPLPDEVEQYDAYHRRRLSVKPGITCIWQVSGRNDIDFEQWVNLDLEYIDTWSYIQDWRILFKTIPAVLKRDGAS
ncbi:MAG: sugar transferase [Alicyclobacillus herbarius]|uniref:sugar transferase n=1 Tax=Alicyclobacillus herbarius TaxID=122960 RepID=UPI002356EE2F|nr:sugar transferase [Alicyclobacillus herbarius]MCL6634016.1 sugar transferase [Alicyclobacillus herbarius]